VKSVYKFKCFYFYPGYKDFDQDYEFEVIVENFAKYKRLEN